MPARELRSLAQHRNCTSRAYAAAATHLVALLIEKRHPALVVVAVVELEEGQTARSPVEAAPHAETRLLAGQGVLGDAELLEHAEKLLLLRRPPGLHAPRHDHSCQEH